MLLNLEMVIEKISDTVTKRGLGGHESLLSIERWQMYDGEQELKPSVLYIARSDMIRGRLTGPDESALIILGDPSSCPGKIKCPHVFIDDKKIGLIQLINDVTSAFSYYDQIEKKLYAALYEGESFQKLVDIFSPVMSNEIIIMNSDFQLIGQTYPSIRLYEINSLVQDMGKEYIPSEVLTFFKSDPVYANVRDEKEPFLYLASLHNVDIWCMNVFLNNEFICRVTLPESERKFRPYDKELLRYFTGIVQKKYNYLRADDAYQQTSRLSGLMLNLLEGRELDDAVLDRILQYYKIGRGQPFLCAYILPSDGDHFNKTLSAYCDYIERRFEHTVAFEYDKSIICVIMLPDENKGAETVQRKTEEFLRDNYLKAGFSGRFSNLRELPAYYRQARVALETGLSYASFKWFFTFQNECLHYMRRLVTSELRPEYICHPKLTSLKEYDKKHKTNYMDTLTAYLENSRNAVETAKQLFLHRSSMMYRLKRIREISEIDFDDPDELLYLMISIRLM